MLPTLAVALVLSSATAFAQYPASGTYGNGQSGYGQTGYGSQPGQAGYGGQPTGLPDQQPSRGLGSQGQQTEEGVPFFGEGTEESAADTLKKKRPKKPLESYFFVDSVRGRENIVWTLDPDRNHIHIDHIDTLQADFQIQYPFEKKGVGSAYLGNLGAPSTELSFFDRDRSREHSFTRPWNAYTRDVRSMPFYNVKKAFSQLNYAMAGQRARQEEDLGVIHAQNISPQTGFNLGYRSLGTRGIYHWQATRDRMLSLGFNHTGKRYTIHAGYVWNYIYNQENGGMVRDDDIIRDVNNYDISTTIPMSMSSPKSWIRSNTLYLQQSFGIPMRRVTDKHFSIRAHPAIFVGHALEYSRWSKKYTDTYDGTVYTPREGAPTPYYRDWNISPAESRDSLFEGRFSNRLFVQLQPWDRDGVVGTVDGGVGVDMMQFYQFSPEHMLTGVKKRNVKQTDYYAYAGIDGHVRQYFDWAAKAKFYVAGYRRGDMEIDGRAAVRVFVKQKPLSIDGGVRFSMTEPSFWEQNYYTNHFRWSNDFRKESEMRFDVALHIPHIGFSASVHQSVLTNKVYFGPDFVPHQAGGTVSVTGLYLREDLCIPIKSSSINFNHRVMVQWSSDQGVVPVPLVGAYLTYFYEFNVVKNVLRLQIGLEGRYNTAYYAPGYNPGTGQFYNQRDKRIGNYVWVDLFVNAKWKRMRILLKLAHLNEDMFGARNYFGVLHYPQNRRILKLGLSWNFYD